jgi:hypothetical protein
MALLARFSHFSDIGQGAKFNEEFGGQILNLELFHSYKGPNSTTNIKILRPDSVSKRNIASQTLVLQHLSDVAASKRYRVWNG